jgi:hypothetical protein
MRQHKLNVGVMNSRYGKFERRLPNAPGPGSGLQVRDQPRDDHSVMYLVFEAVMRNLVVLAR